jgi:hypothetical protein
MTTNHLEHKIAAFPGSLGRGGLESPVGHPSRIEGWTQPEPFGSAEQ